MFEVTRSTETQLELELTGAPRELFELCSYGSQPLNTRPDLGVWYLHENSDGCGYNRTNEDLFRRVGIPLSSVQFIPVLENDVHRSLLPFQKNILEGVSDTPARPLEAWDKASQAEFTLRRWMFPVILLTDAATFVDQLDHQNFHSPLVVVLLAPNLPDTLPPGVDVVLNKFTDSQDTAQEVLSLLKSKNVLTRPDVSATRYQSELDSILTVPFVSSF